MSKKSLFELIEETKRAKQQEAGASPNGFSKTPRARTSGSKKAQDACFSGDLEKEIKEMEHGFSDYSKKKITDAAFPAPKSKNDIALAPLVLPQKKEAVAPVVPQALASEGSAIKVQSAPVKGGMSQFPLPQKTDGGQKERAGYLQSNREPLLELNKKEHALSEHTSPQDIDPLESQAVSEKEEVRIGSKAPVKEEVLSVAKMQEEVPAPAAGSWVALVKKEKAPASAKKKFASKKGVEQDDRGAVDKKENRRSPRGSTFPPKEMSKEEALKKVWNKALWLCARAEQFSVVLEQKLKMDCKKWGISEEYTSEILRTVLSKLVQVQAVDDARYCFSFLRGRVQRGGLKKAKQELKQKGASTDLIEAAVCALEEEGLIPEEKSILEELWERKFSSKVPVEEKEKNKQLRFFLGKGFSFSQILALWKRSKQKE